MNTKNSARYLIVIVAIATIGLASPSAYAAFDAGSTLVQQITAGAISTDIRDESNNIVASPSFTMGSVAISTEQQSATGTFGTASQRISVDNPGGASSGWTLSLNAATPGTGTWTSGANSYAYNGTAPTGQLTVNPAVGTITSVTGTNTGLTLGASTAFTGSTPITLLSAAAGADDIWNGYITGVSLTQTIPAAQVGGSYSISMVQTVTAI